MVFRASGPPIVKNTQKTGHGLDGLDGQDQVRTVARELQSTM